MPNAKSCPWRKLILGDYPVLESALLHIARDLKQADPLKSLIVAIPSHLLGLHLGRNLADNGLAHINTRFLTLEDLTAGVAAPALLASDRSEAASLLITELVGEITAGLAGSGNDFYFKEIAKRPGLHEALLSTIRDLKIAGLKPEVLHSQLDRSQVRKAVHVPKLADVHRIWKAYERRIDDLGWYDAADVLETACREAPKSRLLTGASAILIYGFYDFNTLQKRFIGACSQSNNVAAFVPFTEEDAFDYVKPVIGWFKAQGFEEAPAEPQATDNREPPLKDLGRCLFSPDKPVRNIEANLTIISAPGEAREVREIIRLVSQEAVEEDVPLYDTVVLLRHSHPYTSIFRDTLGGLGLEAYILEGPPMNQTRAGRSLCLLLDILRLNFARNAVMEFAAFAPIDPNKYRPRGRDLIPVALWDLVSIDAGILEGEDQWTAHLTELLKQRKEAGARTRPYTTDAIESLIGFADHLIESLTSVKLARTWSGMIESLIAAYTSLVRTDEHTPQVVAALRQISQLDNLDVEPSIGNLLGLIERTMGETLSSDGRFQRNGPAVVSLIAARGIPFDTVIIPGMVERFFPTAPRQNAVLLDSERKALNLEISGEAFGPIELQAERRLELERLFFRLAIGAARRRLVLTFPRLTTGTARERVPSSLILATVEAATASRADFDTVEDFPAFNRIPLSRIGADEPREALDEAEFDIALGSRDIAKNTPDGLYYLRRTSRYFAGAVDIETSKWGKRAFTSYDGILASTRSRKLLKSDYSILTGSVAPTRLETYATCPYRYYLSEILRVEALVEPERVETINPLDRGSLIHSILWEFFAKIKKQRGRVPFTLKPGDLKVLRSMAGRGFDRFEKLGLTGYPMMWEIAQREIIARLEELFAEELQQAEYFPAYFEVRHGMKSKDALESEISGDRPVPVTFGKTEISLRGKIDRIDLTQDCKRARVVDYKTGRAASKYKDNSLGEGNALQLPLYLYAAQAMLKHIHKDVRIDYAEYYHIAVGGRKRHVVFDYDELEAQKDALTFIIETIANGIAGGLFFAYPQDDVCRYCDFDLICGNTKEQMFQRKSGDKRIAAFLKMKGKAEDQDEENA
jgi:superfamily I DNA/RNA helicase/CRISPR/Cas system-associated exonuclease Cas4 (RecB family)